MKVFLLLGGLDMLISVALGAFGAHALKRRLSEDMLNIYQTGVQYQMAHALGLLLIALIPGSLASGPLLYAAGWLLFAGIVLFSGSLYALSLSGVRKLGANTPLGGLCFLAGWALLAVAVLQS